MSRSHLFCGNGLLNDPIVSPVRMTEAGSGKEPSAMPPKKRPDLFAISGGNFKAVHCFTRKEFESPFPVRRRGRGKPPFHLEQEHQPVALPLIALFGDNTCQVQFVRGDGQPHLLRGLPAGASVGRFAGFRVELAAARAPEAKVRFLGALQKKNLIGFVETIKQRRDFVGQAHPGSEAVVAARGKRGSIPQQGTKLLPLQLDGFHATLIHLVVKGQCPATGFCELSPSSSAAAATGRHKGFLETRVHGAEQCPRPHIRNSHFPGGFHDGTGLREQFEELHLAWTERDLRPAQNAQARAQFLCVFFLAAHVSGEASVSQSARGLNTIGRRNLTPAIASGEGSCYEDHRYEHDRSITSPGKDVNGLPKSSISWTNPFPISILRRRCGPCARKLTLSSPKPSTIAPSASDLTWCSSKRTSPATAAPGTRSGSTAAPRRFTSASCC